MTRPKPHLFIATTTIATAATRTAESSACFCSEMRKKRLWNSRVLRDITHLRSCYYTILTQTLEQEHKPKRFDLLNEMKIDRLLFGSMLTTWWFRVVSSRGIWGDRSINFSTVEMFVVISFLLTTKVAPFHFSIEKVFDLLKSFHHRSKSSQDKIGHKDRSKKLWPKMMCLRSCTRFSCSLRFWYSSQYYMFNEWCTKCAINVMKKLQSEMLKTCTLSR